MEKMLLREHLKKTKTSEAQSGSVVRFESSLGSTTIGVTTL